MNIKIVFFASSNYCLPILESINQNFKLIAIVTKKDQSVEKYAKSHNIDVFTPKDPTELLTLISQISQIKPDLAIVADYGLIIPKEIFTIPRFKTLNIHFSKLPKLCGPSPVQYTILMGEKSAWISVIVMDEGIDTGDIIWQKEVKPLTHEAAVKTPGRWPNGLLPGGGILEEYTSESLYKKLFNIIALELPDIIKKYINNELKPQKQDHTKATYTKHFTREDGFIPGAIINKALQGLPVDQKQLSNWQLAIKVPQLLMTSDQLPMTIERASRALSPWPGVWTEITLRHPRGGKLSLRSYDSPGVEETGKKRLKILKVHLIPLDSGDRHTKVEYKLAIDQVQLEGKNPVSWKQFKEGYPNAQF